VEPILSDLQSRRQPAAPWLFLAAGLVILVTVLVYLRSNAFGENAASLDHWIRESIQGRRARHIERIAEILTQAGSPRVLYALAGAAAVILWWRRGWRHAPGTALAPLLAWTFHNGAKEIFDRVRPPGGLDHESTSFPSGHATTASAVLVTVAYTMWRERLLPPAGAVLLGAVGPISIAWSRIRIDEHWATDVLAGWALGLMVAGLSGLVHRWIVKRQSG
jgi:membrane-associated phospholipid phosphatase